jgi:hypothetical protein
MPKISELPAATSAADADQLPANQGGTTRRLTVAQLRAGLASAAHTHSIAEVANLQTALDAKQPIDSDLTALANNTANGLWARTGNGTGAARSIAAGSGIAVANGDGVAGNPTVSLNFTLANIPQGGATAGQVLKWNGTSWAPANDETATGGGGVSSVGLSLPGQFNVTGSPVTSSGTLTAAWANQAQNAVLAGPASGGPGAPAFRALAAADLPAAAVQTSRQVASGTGLTGGGDLSADRTLALTGQALALHTLGTNGVIARTGAGTVAARSIAAGTGITVTNGDGVAGNPTVSLNFTLANIPQGGATTGQVLKWNGSAWAPANDETGGTPSWGSISGIPVSVSAVGALTPAANTFPYYTGASAAALGAISAFALARLAEGSAADWLAALGIQGIALGANQVAVKNNANDALEPRTQKVNATFAVPMTANGTVELAMWGDIPTTLSQVRIRTFAGTCSVQIQKNGTPISGFATAVAQGTTVTATASTEPLAEDNRLTLVVTGATGLTGLHIVLKGVRTGN